MRKPCRQASVAKCLKFSFTVLFGCVMANRGTLREGKVGGALVAKYPKQQKARYKNKCMPRAWLFILKDICITILRYTIVQAQFELTGFTIKPISNCRFVNNQTKNMMPRFGPTLSTIQYWRPR